jgi:hypothetical protein
LAVIRQPLAARNASLCVNEQQGAGDHEVLIQTDRTARFADQRRQRAGIDAENTAAPDSPTGARFPLVA